MQEKYAARKSDSEERKRLADRKRIAAKRAAMTPEERAEARRDHDRIYRERHREDRRAYESHTPSEAAQLVTGDERIRCLDCDRHRKPDEPDYNPIQLLIGQAPGWYSGDDGELCGDCLTVLFETANRL